jgi:hypothetical protein
LLVLYAIVSLLAIVTACGRRLLDDAHNAADSLVVLHVVEGACVILLKGLDSHLELAELVLRLLEAHLELGLKLLDHLALAVEVLLIMAALLLEGQVVPGKLLAALLAHDREVGDLLLEVELLVHNRLIDRPDLDLEALVET